MEPYVPNDWQKGDRVSATKMRRLESTVSTIAAELSASGEQPPVFEIAFGDPVGQPVGEWTPVFGDDFDQPISVVDAAAGQIQFGDGPIWGTRLSGDWAENGGRTQDGSKGWFSTDQVTQVGSTARLYATYSPDASRPNNPFLTGMLESALHTQTHGYIEARIKNPYVAGSWKRFGLIGKNQPQPRIDVVGQRGTLGDQKITTFKNDQLGTPGSLNEQYVGWTQDWMTVAVEWTDTELIFYIEGVEVTRDTNLESVPDRPMHLLAQMLIDPNDPTDSTKFPVYTEIDYIRSWQKAEPTTLAFEEKFLNAADWRMTVGSLSVANEIGTFKGVAGIWSGGLAAYLTAMPAMRDLDITFDIALDSLEESFTSLVLRSDGTQSGGGGPIAAYGIVWAPHQSKWDLERFDYGGNGNVIMGGVDNYPYGAAGTVHTVRLWLDGGEMKAKMWPADQVQPDAWDVEYVMGADKANDYVLGQTGKAFLTSLNGGSGVARDTRLRNMKIRTAGQPDPIPFMKQVGGGEDGGDGGETPETGGPRYGAYTLGGGTGVDNNGNDLTTVRIPVKLPKKARRLRVHVTNRFGLSDYNMPNGPSILRATFGKKSSTSANELALSSVQSFPAGSGSLNNGQEYVSGWLEPDFDTRDFAWISLVAQFTGTDIVTSYSGHGFYANNGGDIASDLSGNGWVDYGVTPFNSYIEYEYEDDGEPQILFIGDSIPEGYVEGGKPGAAGTNMRNWKGHIDSYPEAYGRHTGRVAVNNSYASSKINDWRAGSPKWTRFNSMTEKFDPAAIVIHLGGNDLFGGQNFAEIGPEMESFLKEIKAMYPRARIMLFGMMPLLATSSEGATGFQNRVKLNTLYASISREILDEYIEPDNGLYDPATGANENIRPKYCSFDGLHLAPAAYELMAQAIQI